MAASAIRLLQALLCSFGLHPWNPQRADARWGCSVLRLVSVERGDPELLQECPTCGRWHRTWADDRDRAILVVPVYVKQQGRKG